MNTDLAAGNIRSTVTIFGVAGNSNVVDTTSGDTVAGEIANGKKAWVDGQVQGGFDKISAKLHELVCPSGGNKKPPRITAGGIYPTFSTVNLMIGFCNTNL